MIFQLTLVLFHIGGLKAQAFFNFDNQIYYKINGYYGSREQEFYTRKAILNGNMTTFKWPSIMDIDYQNNSWITDKNFHVIKKIDPNGVISIIAGKYGKTGYRDGDRFNTLFNYPSSVAVYEVNRKKQIIEMQTFTIILNSDSLECQYADYKNYSSCENISNSNEIISPEKIKRIVNISEEEISSLLNNNNYTSSISPLNESVLFIADTNNHCIRIFYISLNISDTYAGKCGEPGFMDGPFGDNRFNKPENLGVDFLGNVMVYDKGNNYIRMIMNNIFTLVNGACSSEKTLSPILIPRFNINIKMVTCYRAWIKTFGEPIQHIYQPEDNTNKCYIDIFVGDLVNGTCVRVSDPLLYKNRTEPKLGPGTR